MLTLGHWVRIKGGKGVGPYRKQSLDSDNDGCLKFQRHYDTVSY